MNLSDYLIDQAGKDWSELLSGWSPPLPSAFTVWLVNRFGDVFVVFEDESVHMLDVGGGTLTRLADSRDDFAAKIDQIEKAKDWLLLGLLDACVIAGITLKENQCYGWKMPPILGGEYAVSNVVPADLSVHYSFLADIYSQTKDLPDATRIEVVVRNRPRGTSSG